MAAAALDHRIVAGKSTTAWAAYRRLVQDGVAAAYVDIDQLGMLYPDTAADPEGHRTKASLLVDLLPGYVAAGVRVLIVSGIVDPATGPDLPDADLTTCVLVPSEAELTHRLVARGWAAGEVAEALAEAAALSSARFAGRRLDVAGLAADQVVDRVLPLVTLASAPMSTPAPPGSSAARARVLLLTGARVSGTSTLGFGAAAARWSSGGPGRTGFVDLDQLSFVGDVEPQVRLRLEVGQLVRAHEQLSRRGADLLVVASHLGPSGCRMVRAALPAATVDVVRLRADAATLDQHARARVLGGTARLAGDDLLGARDGHRVSVVAAAVAEQRAADEVSDHPGHVLDVSKLPPTAALGRLSALLPETSRQS